MDIKLDLAEDLADEVGAAIIALLREIVTQTGITVVLATHYPKVMEAADCAIKLKDGRLVGEKIVQVD